MQDELDGDQSFPMLCTQETDEDIDVIWDFNSPRGNKGAHIRVKKQKRLCPSQSPKLTIRRHASNTQIPKFEKLKEEVEALREVLTGSKSKPDNAKKKSVDDLEDDSFEEQLILCSQMVENEFMSKTKLDSSTTLHSICKTRDTQKSSIDNLLHGTLQNNNVCKSPGNKLADDSFDLAIGELDDFELPQTSQDNKKEQITFPKTDYFRNNNHHTFRTHSSFEQLRSDSKADTSPIKCSPEEIELKRLEALAKLRAKKEQTVIEKNRQEALKRLQMNKQRRGLQAHGTLLRRTHSSSR